MLRPLRRPRLWLAAWVAMVLAVIVLSLVPPPDVTLQLPRHADKVEHLLAYAALAFGALQLFASRLMLAWVGVGLVLLGIGLEVAQGTLFSAVRMMDWRDALANAAGVGLGLAPFRTRGATMLLRWESRT